MEKKIIHTGGFALFLSSFLEAGCIILLILYPYATITNLIEVAGIFLFAGGTFYFAAYIFFNRIEVDENKIIVKSFFKIKIEVKEIKLKEIKRIAVGRTKYLQDVFNENENILYKELNKLWKRYDGDYYRFVTQTVVSFSDLLVIEEKDSSVNIFSTKPFSKVGFRKLLRTLDKNTVTIFVQDKTLVN